MKYKVKTTKTASLQIRAEVAWWRANRPDAKRSLKKEIDDAVTLIAEQPGIGASARDIEFEGTQRWHLRSLPYAVYYEVDDVKRIVYLPHSGRRDVAPAPTSEPLPLAAPSTSSSTIGYARSVQCEHATARVSSFAAATGAV